MLPSFLGIFDDQYSRLCLHHHTVRYWKDVIMSAFLSEECQLCWPYLCCCDKHRKKKKKAVQKERLFLLLPVLWVSTLALVDTLCLAQSDTATSRWQQSVPTVFSPLGSQEPRRNNKNTRWFSLYYHFWFCLAIHLFRGSHNDLMNCFPCYLFLSVNTQQSHKSMLLYFLGFPQPNQVHNPD